MAANVEHCDGRALRRSP
uniref:Uncharacterized protein n=1 Tax=Arundo donax TaxID=35708 RepID=A0A0A9B7A4_ARUDO